MKNRCFKILITTFLFSFFTVFSQENKPLPNNLTQQEKSLLANYQFRNSQLTNPPTGSVRAAAEWEEVEYLVVTWQSSYQNILRQIVAAAVNECKVIITTQNQTAVSSYLTANGVDLTNVIFMNSPSNSIWIRDYAGNTIYSDDVGQRALTDWIYNRPRPYDDIMPTNHANLTGIPLYITNTGTNDLVNTGGNYMSDGLGNAFASDLILDENATGNPYNVSAKTEAQINNIMFNYMGISNFIKMPTLPYDVIHHIDMHMKLLDEQTLLVSHYPQGVADGPQITANINYVLENYTSPFGTPYHIKWIDAPPSTTGSYPNTGGSYRTFSNCVFVNKSILVPTYRPEVDAPALAYFQQILPGYNVVGIDVDNANENLISSLGAIHCITHTIGVADPLLIIHKPIEQANAGTNLTISAMLKHVSGIQTATVFWRESGSTVFNQTLMTLVSNNDWSATLSIPTTNVAIEYYIRGVAMSGKAINRPIVAPEGFWTIEVQSLKANEWAKNHISDPYPNPTKEKVNFNLNQIEGKIKITITNLLGQILANQKDVSGNGIITLDLKADWKGTLLINFEGEFGKITKKIIKL